MKKASRKVIQYFPGLQDCIPEGDSVLLEQQTLNKLNETEQVFLKLVRFFEKPEENHFNLIDLYKNLQDDWLSFALECITVFFEQDTYLLKETDFSIITEDKEYLNQSDFASYLNQYKDLHGKNFSRSMVNTYVKRHVLPAPDLVIAGNKYWLKQTCDDYLLTLSQDN